MRSERGDLLFRPGCPVPGSDFQFFYPYPVLRKSSVHLPFLHRKILLLRNDGHSPVPDIRILLVRSIGTRLWRSAARTTWQSRVRILRKCRCSAVLPPVGRCVRLSEAGRPCTPPAGSGRNLGRFPRKREADENEAGERAGDNAAPAPPLLPAVRAVSGLLQRGQCGE